jgi:hypothetical protein
MTWRFDQGRLDYFNFEEINIPRRRAAGYVGSIRKFIVLRGLLPTYRL